MYFFGYQLAAVGVLLSINCNSIEEMEPFNIIGVNVNGCKAILVVLYSAVDKQQLLAIEQCLALPPAVRNIVLDIDFYWI